MKVAKKFNKAPKSKTTKNSFKNGKVNKMISKEKTEKSFKTKLKKTKQLGSMTVDDFMVEEENLSSEDEASVISEELLENEINLDQNNGNDKDNTDENDDENEEDNDSEVEEKIDIDEFKSHKQSLHKLKEIDPEFYKFLEQNDKKLLRFDVSDSEADDDDEEDEVKNEAVHKPSEELEVASDEDDFVPDGETHTDGRNITLQLLKKWQIDIQKDKSSTTINCLAKAFHAALIRVSSEDEQVHCEYRVDGASVFNAVIQLCVLELGPAVRRYLRLPAGSKQAPHKCKKFVKIRTLLRGYFLDLLKLLGGVTSTNILNVLLKHLHGMASLIASYSSITKKMLKRLVHIWGTAEESVRVVAFLCILRITNNQQASYLSQVLKSMYMTYVKNCKFMSVTNMAEINFMRRSLVEMFALDVNASYQHVFLYIRQLAIHLRTATTLHKKENIQGVYNWQFINSLHLWAALLSATCNKTQLQPLIYPLVQVAIGTIKLVPTAQYFPLRFHILQILIDISRDTNIFIPILPLLIEVLTSYDFSKKNKKVSMKPLNFNCLLRLSKSQMSENGFKDGVIDTVYGLLLEYMSTQSHTISYPDLSLLCTMQIKQFLKDCSVANYTKKLRQILEKIEQNNQFILKERKGINFTITDQKQIEAWESNVKNKGTPITSFYENWRKLHTAKKQKELTNNDALGEFNLPVLRKGQKPRDLKRKDGPVELFPSDSEDDGPEVPREEKPKEKRGKRGSKKKKTFEKVTKEVDDDKGDIVEDTKASDW